MSLTAEQQAVLNHIQSGQADGTIVQIDAKAGSGKTHLLTAIANAIPHTNSLYICYNKSIAVEASRKFPATTACSTTHSVAYRAVVKPYNLRVGTFSYKQVNDGIPYETKLVIIELIREFCLSSYLSFDQFATDNHIPQALVTYCLKYLNLMESGKIECTHDFYLKVFHIGLSTQAVTYEPFDFILLDESGDLNEVTLEIFRLLPARFKIAVGDRHQNIYTFNHTINAFDLLASEGTLFHMTKSFRVATSIASSIESFCRKHLDPEMSFIGTDTSDQTITTRAYLTRTNSALVGKMIELDEAGTPYSLVRKATEIFKLPLLVINFKHQGTISDPLYSHLQVDIDHWYEEVRYQLEAPGLYGYLLSLYENDVPLVNALKLVIRYGKDKVKSAYAHSRTHENTKCNLTLLTVHSSKGLEFDEVTISDDMNEVIDQIITNSALTGNPYSADELAELRLYYVACSRAKLQLNNANLLYR